MIALSSIFLLCVMVFQSECCSINKMVLHPFNHGDCTNIHSTMNCPSRFLKHGPMFPHRGIPCPPLAGCDPYASKLAVSTVIPPQLECMDPMMTKCCCCQCAKAFPYQDLQIQMLPNECWCK